MSKGLRTARGGHCGLNGGLALAGGGLSVLMGARKAAIGLGVH